MVWKSCVKWSSCVLMRFYWVSTGSQHIHWSASKPINVTVTSWEVGLTNYDVIGIIICVMASISSPSSYKPLIFIKFTSDTSLYESWPKLTSNINICILCFIFRHEVSWQHLSFMDIFEPRKTWSPWSICLVGNSCIWSLEVGLVHQSGWLDFVGIDGLFNLCTT